MELTNRSAVRYQEEDGLPGAVEEALVDLLRNRQVDDDDLAMNPLAQLCERPWGLLVISNEEFARRNEQASAAGLEPLPPDHVLVELDDYLVGFMPHADADRCARTLAGKDDDSPIAVSLPFGDLNDVAQQYDFARYCLNSPDASPLAKLQSKALGFLKSAIIERAGISGMLHPALGILARYDRENQSEMLETLRVYLENDRNAQRCANLLYLHRNSLQYRVKRIQEIAGIDLDDPDERAYLRLSLFLGA